VRWTVGELDDDVNDDSSCSSKTSFPATTPAPALAPARVVPAWRCLVERAADE
jgi:hypothetical protein